MKILPASPLGDLPPMVAIELVRAVRGAYPMAPRGRMKWVGFDEASGGVPYPSAKPILYPEVDVRQRMEGGGYLEDAPCWRVRPAADVEHLHPYIDRDALSYWRMMNQAATGSE